MGSYGQDDDLDEYEDDFIDDQDGGVRANRYKDEEFEDEDEVEEEEVEEEPISEEALKLLKYRQKLKDELRSKLRQENGDGLSKSLDRGRKPPLTNFGSFFGPSQPVIADRVAQESRALLESRHLAPKAATSQSNGKKVNAPSVSGAKNDVSRQPNNNATQVKSKAQLMKQTRDYSFLLSEDADVAKPPTDPGQPKHLPSKPDSRPTQVPSQRITSPGHSSRKVMNSTEQRKPRGTPQVCSTRTAPFRKVTSEDRTSNISSDPRRQQDLRKQPQITKKTGTVNGNGSIRPPVKTLPPKKPVSSTDKKMIMERKTPPVTKKIVPNGQRPPPEKSRAPGVIRSQERNVNVHQGRDRVVKKENASTQMKPPPKQSHVRGTLDRDRACVQKPRGQLSVHSQSGSVRKDSNPRKRRAEEIDVDDDDDYRSVLKMLGPRKRYVDDYDDEDMCMEVGFDTILKEESRSARIARQEDEEELAKIMEEERREKLRRESKMHKKIRQ